MLHIDTIMKALPWTVLHGYTASDHAYGWYSSHNTLSKRLTAAKKRIVVVPWTQYASTIFVDTQKRIQPSIEEDSGDDTATEEQEEDAGKNFKPRSSSNNNNNDETNH